jgi:hypothetical protein
MAASALHLSKINSPKNCSSLGTNQSHWSTRSIEAEIILIDVISSIYRLAMKKLGRYMARHRYVEPLWTCTPHCPLDNDDDVSFGISLCDDDDNTIKGRVLD